MINKDYLRLSRDTIMSRRWFGMTILASACSGDRTTTGSFEQPQEFILSSALNSFANTARQTMGLEQFTTSSALTSVAKSYARTLASSQEFSHSVGGRSLSNQVTLAGYDFGRISENIARSSKQLNAKAMANETVNNWLSSARHRKNLLDPRLRDIGSAVTKRSDHIFFVQIYGVQN